MTSANVEFVVVLQQQRPVTGIDGFGVFLWLDDVLIILRCLDCHVKLLI